MSNSGSGFVQAKPTAEDIQTVREFFLALEEYFDYGTVTTGSDEFEDESEDVIPSQFVRHLRSQWQTTGPAWRRVIESCDVLVRHCTDPDVPHLEWRSDLRAFLDGKYEERVEREVRALSEMIQRRRQQIQQQQAANVL